MSKKDKTKLNKNPEKQYQFFNSCRFYFHPEHKFWVFLPTSHEGSKSLSLSAYPEHWSLTGVETMIMGFRSRNCDYEVSLPWDLTRFYKNAEDCLKYHDLHFLRYWLDQIVLWEGYYIWNNVEQVKRKELAQEKNPGKKAEAAADEVVRQFEELFA